MNARIKHVVSSLEAWFGKQAITWEYEIDADNQLVYLTNEIGLFYIIPMAHLESMEDFDVRKYECPKGDTQFVIDELPF